MNKYDVIYARQSVDKIDSISIESQVEYCQYEVRGGEYKEFIDKGYSGKNLERPQFKAMMEAIRGNEVSRVIVYKLDRISRSILDFANMMAEFQKYGVEFVSCTEKFDTSTPMGRAMLNICIVFAQLERETIQKRVEDAYISRSRRGFYMGGRIPYGFKLETYLIDGKKTSRYTIEPAEVETVKLIFSLYAKPQTSYGDVVRYLENHNIKNLRTANGAWSRTRISDMIKNPVYAQADLDIYRFYKDQGAVIHNNPEDFTGAFGCYLYSEKNIGYKQTNLKGHHIVLAPHAGLIPSDIWLKARIKCLNNQQVAKPLKASNTWLAGKIKCAKCGYALTIRKNKLKNGFTRYFICSWRMNSNSCEGVGGVRADALESIILSEMAEHLKRFETLSETEQQRDSPKMHELNIKIGQLSEEIDKLMCKVADADELLLNYIQKRIHELDSLRNNLQQELSQLSSQLLQRRGVTELRDYMSHWDELSFDDKRAVVDQLISAIKVDTDACEIIWKF